MAHTLLLLLRLSFYESYSCDNNIHSPTPHNHPNIIYKNVQLTLNSNQLFNPLPFLPLKKNIKYIVFNFNYKHHRRIDIYIYIAIKKKIDISISKIACQRAESSLNTLFVSSRKFSIVLGRKNIQNLFFLTYTRTFLTTFSPNYKFYNFQLIVTTTTTTKVVVEVVFNIFLVVLVKEMV